MITQREIYLDANATHPYLPEVRAALSEALLNSESILANPSSVHRRGQGAKAMVAKFRETLCEFLGRPEADEFILCSGATEALNTVLRGFVQNRRAKNRQPVIVSTGIEHRAILDTLTALSSPAAPATAAKTVLINVDSSGQISPTEFIATLSELFADPLNDVLLALQVVNNEVGCAYDLPALMRLALDKFARQPVAKLPKAKGGRMQFTPQRLFVCLDAAQALGKMDDSYLRTCLHYADYAAFSGHKIGAPMGTGVLWLRAEAPFEVFMTGGTQERKRRAGTLNSLGIYGFYQALQAWHKKGEDYRRQFKVQREYLAKEMLKIPGLKIHGLKPDGSLPALLNTLNFHVDGCVEESLLLSLDLDGFCLSSGSACNSGSLKPSHVITALGFDEDVAISSIRLSLGVENTMADLEAFVKSLNEKVAQVRAARLQARELFGEESLPLKSLDQSTESEDKLT